MTRMMMATTTTMTTTTTTTTTTTMMMMMTVMLVMMIYLIIKIDVMSDNKHFLKIKQRGEYKRQKDEVKIEKEKEQE